MPEFLTPADLQVFKPSIDPAKAAAMIADASAMAIRVAPCIKDTTDTDVLAAVKAVLRSAILRWEESGSGALVTKQRTTGPFGEQETYDNRAHRSGMFWPDEIDTLQGLCASSSAEAFAVDSLPSPDLDRVGGWLA